jgi:S-formylglutathione hydrolase
VKIRIGFASPFGESNRLLNQYYCSKGPFMRTISERRCFGGTLGYYSHDAQTTGCAMGFTVYVPPGAANHSLPVLWWLSGLTCTEDNFTSKAGAYRQAAASGLIIVAPDTSPRGEQVPDDPGYDLGQGAGFYIDATRAPWSEHFHMYSYVTDELPRLIEANFPVNASAQGISGHSMGGHGALMLGLKNPDRYQSISAFAPIVAPSQCPWGQKAFTAYLGEDTDAWTQYDATQIMTRAGDRSACPAILIDQGLGDEFLATQLMPDKFATACESAGQKLEFRQQEGYDHSYFFIASFIDDHVRHHGDILNG